MMNEANRRRVERFLRRTIKADAAKLDRQLGVAAGGTLREICDALGYPLVEATAEELNVIYTEVRKVFKAQKISSGAR